MIRRSVFVFALVLAMGATAASQPAVRVKDVADVQGVRENQLMGFGLVTGLEGRGDDARSALLQHVMANLLSGFGIRIPEEDIRSRNCAAVMVTADIPGFVRSGARVPVTVSSIGDATSLEGGVLLHTELQAANGSTYAVAQGPLSLARSNDAVRTVGVIPGGALVEREVLSTFLEDNTFALVLRTPDFATVNAMATAIRDAYPDLMVDGVDAALVRVAIPEDFTGSPVELIAGLERVSFVPDSSATVVIDPRSGVIVVGRNVRIAKVAVSYQDTNVTVGGSVWEEETPEQFVIEDTATVDDLVQLLQDVGVETNTIIEILRAVERAGALYGRLVIM
jgi:flagellar P-ring protein precursor FlgI